MAVLKYSDLLGGSGTGTGTVTSVSGTGSVSGLTLTGTVTSSGNLTLGGTLSVTPSNFGSQTSKFALIAPVGSAGVPTFRQITWADLTSTPTTKAGYNITDVYSITQIDNMFSSLTGTGTVTNVSGTLPISVATGTSTPVISIAAATTSAAGSMSAADKTKLDGITAGAQPNVSTNLSLGTITGTGIPLNSSTGSGVTLPSATTSAAGLMSAADKTSLNGLVSGGGVTGISGRYLVKVNFTGGSPSSTAESNFPVGWTITTGTGKVTFTPTIQVAKAPILVTFYSHISANNTDVLKFPLNSAPVSVSSTGVIDISLYSYDVGADANGGYTYVNILF